MKMKLLTNDFNDDDSENANNDFDVSTRMIIILVRNTIAILIMCQKHRMR